MFSFWALPLLVECLLGALEVEDVSYYCVSGQNRPIEQPLPKTFMMSVIKEPTDSLLYLAHKNSLYMVICSGQSYMGIAEFALRLINLQQEVVGALIWISVIQRMIVTQHQFLHCGEIVHPWTVPILLKILSKTESAGCSTNFCHLWKPQGLPVASWIQSVLLGSGAGPYPIHPHLRSHEFTEHLAELALQAQLWPMSPATHGGTGQPAGIRGGQLRKHMASWDNASLLSPRGLCLCCFLCLEHPLVSDWLFLC